MRLGILLLTGLLAVIAPPAQAEDIALPPPAAEGNLLEDVVDGVGGILKVLVGPPISSPSPYLNLPGNFEPAAEPAKPQSRPAAVTAPAPPPPPVGPKPVVAAPVPVPPVPPPAVPVTVVPPPAKPKPPAVKPVEAAPPPPPRPVTVIATPAPVVAPVVEAPRPSPPAEPGCVTRIAATATVEQAAKLRRCK